MIASEARTETECRCPACAALAAAIDRHASALGHVTVTRRQVEYAAACVNARHGLTEPDGGTQWRARR